jgi:hypothetical protein
VGREEEVDSFRDAIDEGPGSPARAILLTGARGTGKTVLLNTLEDTARQAGWLVASATMRADARTGSSTPRSSQTCPTGTEISSSPLPPMTDPAP